ncbi:zinc finger, CCHC-type containing protein [Tanacetum coccineum]
MVANVNEVGSTKEDMSIPMANAAHSGSGDLKDYGVMELNDASYITWRFIHIVAGDGVAGIKRRLRDLYSDGVRNFATTSGRGRLKEILGEVSSHEVEEVCLLSVSIRIVLDIMRRGERMRFEVVKHMAATNGYTIDDTIEGLNMLLCCVSRGVAHESLLKAHHTFSALVLYPARELAVEIARQFATLGATIAYLFARMVTVSVLNDALKSMYNAEKRGNRQVMMRPNFLQDKQFQVSKPLKNTRRKRNRIQAA